MGAIVNRPGEELANRQGPRVEDFLRDLDISPASRATYARSLRQFVLWLGQTGRAGGLDALQREDILQYREWLLSEGRSSYTVTGYLTAVRRLYEWLEGRKLCPNIARGIKGARKPKGFRKDCLSAGQLRQTLAAMRTGTLEGLRDYALLNLMARTGLRDIEIARALVGDIRQEAGQPVLWIQGKGRDTKDEFVLLLEEALQPIREYLQARGSVSKEEPLFCSHSDRNKGQALTTRSISRIVKAALKQAGLDDKRLTAHSLRHTAITLSIVGGASLQQAQAMARHSDPRTTLVYFHNLDRIKAGAERHIHF